MASKPNIMLVLVKLIANLSIAQKPNFHYVNIHIISGPKSCLKVRGLS